jgi:hypothetical protein
MINMISEVQVSVEKIPRNLTAGTEEEETTREMG